jgi:hypothetical protein
MRHVKQRTPFLSLAVLLASAEGLAMKVPTGNANLDLNINVLLQTRAEGSFDGESPTATEGASPYGTFNTDFYIRRARFIGNGIVYKFFTYNLMLDMPFFGRRGNYGGSTFVQDLAVGFIPYQDIIIEGGFLFMPFAHQSPASGASGILLEGLGTILASLYNNQRGLRETGVQVRALILNRRLLIRGGAYEGAHGDPAARFVVNPNGRPLWGGMLRLNLIGYETAYAYPGIYIDGKSRLSIGVGGHFQSKGSNVPVTQLDPVTGRPAVNPTTGARLPPAPTGVDHYRAWAADVFADLALPGDTEFVLALTGFRFNWGKGSDKTGYGSSGEIGYRVGQIAPQANFYWFNSDSRWNSFLKLAGGLNWFLRGSQVRLTLEFASVINGRNLNNTRALHLVTLQGQLNL